MLQGRSIHLNILSDVLGQSNLSSLLWVVIVRKYGRRWRRFYLPTVLGQGMSLSLHDMQLLSGVCLTFFLAVDNRAYRIALPPFHVVVEAE